MEKTQRGECELSKLIPAPYNPRKISDEQMNGLQASLDRWGLVQDIVVNKKTGHIVGGHQRVNALKVNGIKKAPVVWVDIDEDEEKALNIALNSSFISGEFDYDKLPALLDEVHERLPEVYDDLRFDLFLEDKIPSNTESGGSDEENSALDSVDDIKPAKVERGQEIQIGNATLICGDCVEVLSGMDENSVDAIVTDPPYGIGFMGKDWDCSVPGEEWATQCLRVLKPGGHIISFAATRTVHRLGVVLEDAGFEIRDMVSWLYWQGFPKSHDVSKAIDDKHGAKRKVIGKKKSGIAVPGEGQRHTVGGSHSVEVNITAPATDDAKQWDGWGTALKPAQEPAVLARKPLEGTVADNVLEWGAGGLNIDGCRIVGGDSSWPGPNEGEGGWGVAAGFLNSAKQGPSAKGEPRPVNGRWPANIYACPKPAVSEKQAGDESKNFHPTVKPIKLMRWLVRLVTPPGGTVVDTFLGSGTTCVAAEKEGFKSIGIEFSEEYAGICKARLEAAQDDE